VWLWHQGEPFGNNVPDENPSGLGTFDLPLRLPGQYFDRETNLHYNYYRDYDPSIGRYGESDPIGLKGGLNTYAYVYADPMRLTDLLGLEPPGTMRQRGYFGPRKCPMRPPENDSDWRRYTRRTGEVVFHCGFTCYIEKKAPLTFDPQGECCYDEKNALVDECHKYAGCRGTPNQYDADTDPGKHFWSDSGGIVGSGGPAFNESNRHRRDNLAR
jgi:RHS repeat-associated protein